MIAGNKIEDLDDIIDFSAKAATDPAFAADIIPKYYFNSSLALWYVKYYKTNNNTNFNNNSSKGSENGEVSGSCKIV